MFFGGNKVVFTEIYKLFFRAGFFICLSLGSKVTQAALCVTIVVARSKSLAFIVYTFYATKRQTLCTRYCLYLVVSK